MTRPLIVLAYEKLLPGSQLVNRLEDQGYRVKSVSEAALIAETVKKEKPLLIIVDMEPNFEAYSGAIMKLANGPATSHIPVIALTHSNNMEIEQAARRAGARLVVGDSAILVHLDQFLRQALEV